MATHTFGEDAVARTAERQMRQWALQLEIRDRVAHEHDQPRLPEEIHPYVAISREAGAGGAELARRVSADLGWELLDRELLHFIAERFQLPEWMLPFVDEKSVHWLDNVLGRWVSQPMVTQTEYVRRLGQILLMSVRHASTVVVGRGAQFFLPRDKGLRVRVVAPLERRIERVRYVFGYERDRAIEYIDETDRGRREFVQRYFHRDVADPHQYDLVVNMDRFDFAAAAELVAAEARRRFGTDFAAGRSLRAELAVANR